MCKASAYLLVGNAEQHKLTLIVESLFNRDYPEGLTSNSLE
ncbi:hypothetical protein [Morganella morganii]|nr:hypothetical protein [Morganella morganii]